MYEARLNRIKRVLKILRNSDKYAHALFGANSHRYKLNPPAKEAMVEAWETRHNCQLPDQYREFILQLGNGGAGPDYGLYPLSVPDEGLLTQAAAQCLAINDPRHPLCSRVYLYSFSSEDKHHAMFNPRDVQLAEDEYLSFKDAAINIGTQGCSILNLLVLSGPYAGEVWGCYPEFFTGFYPLSPVPFAECRYGGSPFEADGKTHLLFLDWYEHWLNTGLAWLSQKGEV